MTTMAERPNTALLIVDRQIDVIAKAVGRDAVVRNVASLVAKATSRRLALPLACGLAHAASQPAQELLAQDQPWFVEEVVPA